MLTNSRLWIAMEMLNLWIATIETLTLLLGHCSYNLVHYVHSYQQVELHIFYLPSPSSTIGSRLKTPALRSYGRSQLLAFIRITLGLAYLYFTATGRV